ncbi:hypothetical protein CIHG_05111 [Coccidioides immitis H538.4]|uniref:Uncharacterized protein n=3 Tax=Coccidioides immitis TaxID=5501 RepID=A0A0J8RAF7_COCIT|nr:hypothetical protein CIRG_00216 [Coccidioides immitis RMSCC 2394]KMU81836.1 hypothetical protein CISG_02852 [Coccidioides immitis RMSCC 3703]KMU87170.1 hypothetical protein CIHG_05111 [Coccidioides immitis H538.4]
MDRENPLPSISIELKRDVVDQQDQPRRGKHETPYINEGILSPMPRQVPVRHRPMHSQTRTPSVVALSLNQKHGPQNLGVLPSKSLTMAARFGTCIAYLQGVQ